MKNNFKTRLAVMILITALTLFIFGSCSGGDAKDEKLSVVCTILPIYDWCREIAAGSESVKLTLLLDSGVDLHSYQPTADDIMQIAGADIFICVGGESDFWVTNALAQSRNRDVKVIKLIELLGDVALDEELKEGMEHPSHEEEEPETDEHVWLSLKNARIFCREIAGALCEADPALCELYKSNSSDYTEKLDLLDAKYAETVGGRGATLVFADRFPFRYLLNDYGIDYYAAFAGCSAESEASFKTVIFLAGKVDSLGLGTILLTESSDGKMASTVRDATSSKNQKLLVLDSLQRAGSEEIAKGVTYLSVMESNLTILTEAIGGAG
ncbi:MAG: zinc ABC transporter substrate-binding protein [Clostridia bacterium]|nr:zinc ABC transporter substrate-binding protein [Clostridia bacterium]